MRNLTGFLVMSAVMICVFLNNDIPSVNNMEARNYITAREMLENGSWLLPTMNGNPRIAKPPLPTWITALVMKMAGTDANRSVNRIPAGICAVLLALFTYLIAGRISGNREIAVTAVLILVTGLMFLSAARKNFWDIYTHTAMAGAVWAMLEAVSTREGKNRTFFLFSFLMAFSFLSKGPVALMVMFVPFCAAYITVYGTEGLRDNGCKLAVSLGIAVLISSSWPAYVYLNMPTDTLMVASQEVNGWLTKHTQPPWFYLINFYQITGIWTFFLLYALAAPFIEKKWKEEEKIFVYWFILTVVLLSVIPEKKGRYLLPSVVPGSIASAVSIIRLRDAGSRAWKYVYGPFCSMAGAVCFAASGVMFFFSPAYPAVMVPGALALAVTGITIIASFVRKRTTKTHLAVVTGICLFLVFFTPMRQRILQDDTTEALMVLRDIPELKGRELYYLGDLPEELVWAAGRKVKPISRDLLPTLTESDPGSAVIAEGKTGERHPGLHVLKSIRTRHATYTVYAPFPDRCRRESIIGR